MSNRKRDRRRSLQQRKKHRDLAEQDRVAQLAKSIRTPAELDAVLAETKPMYRPHVKALLAPLVGYVQH